MTFFSEKRLRRIRIEIDDTGLKSDSPEIQQRLNRIEENYHRLDEVLEQLEHRFENDDAFLSLFPEGELPAFEVPKKKKRKWRPRKPR